MQDRYDINGIGDLLGNIRTDIGALLQAQQISNLLALANSNNPKVTQDMKDMAMDSALALLGLGNKMANIEENVFEL